MSLAPHTLRSTRTVKGAKRVGRGNSSQKGTTAGRGTKGQKSRTGGRGGLKLKTLRKQILKVPKVRGFKSFKPRAQTVTLKVLEGAVVAKQVVTPAWLVSRGLIRTVAHPVKVVATGTLTKAITLKDCVASKGAMAIIEKAGGTIVS